MAIQEMTPADVAAITGSNDNGFGGNGWWIILLFLFAGWGGNGFGGNNANSVYPILENQQNMFNGFGNLTNAITAGFGNAETAATARQMADMQQMFAMQQQFSQCCCENRLGLANLGADLAREACADRQAVTDGVRDIIANQTAGIQMIIDKLNSQDLFAERRENDNLRQQINMMTLAASQNQQTADLISALKTTAAAA